VTDWLPDYKSGFSEDLQSLADRVGDTRLELGYLGRADGTSTIVNASRRFNREMYYYGKVGGRPTPFGSARLAEDAGIYYEDSADNLDLPVWLVNRKGTRTIVQLVIPEALDPLNGLTPLEKKFANASALAQGRLTISGSAPIPTPDILAASTLNYLPYKGNLVGIYDGAAWLPYTFTAPTIGLTSSQTGTTANGSPIVTALTSTAQLVVGMEVTGTNIPASTTILSIQSATQITLNNNATGSGAVTLTFKVPANKNIDVFMAVASSAAALRFGPIWTNDTTRATALLAQNGAWVLTGTTGYRYLGTVRTTGTAGVTEDSLLKRYVWNHDNRVERKLKIVETANSWGYTTASYRSWNNSTANRVEMVIGISEEPVWLRFDSKVSSTTASITIAIGIGLDSTTTNGSDTQVSVFTNSTTDPTLHVCSSYYSFPGTGYHFLQLLEYGGTNAIFYGDDGSPTLTQSGALGYVMG
jgi:hypothetical protein